MPARKAGKKRPKKKRPAKGRPRGPKPETLALPGSWMDAVKKALERKPE